MARRKAKLVATSDLSPSVRSLTWELTDGAPWAFAPGQWVNLFVPGQEGLLKRAYSIASPPDAVAARFEIAVTRVEGGAVSPRLHRAPVGTLLEVDGPHGLFTRDARARGEPALFVAAGTGLAPFRSMLGGELRAPGHPALGLLFGCRTPRDLLWREQLEGWAREQGLRLEVTLSRPPAGWAGRVGYVQEHVVEVARSQGCPDVYICGLTDMVKAVRTRLKAELGYDRRRIFSERFD